MKVIIIYSEVKNAVEILDGINYEISKLRKTHAKIQVEHVIHVLIHKGYIRSMEDVYILRIPKIGRRLNLILHLPSIIHFLGKGDLRQSWGAFKVLKEQLKFIDPRKMNPENESRAGIFDQIDIVYFFLRE